MPADHPFRINISSPGDLIAAVPTALGYPPTESVIAVCLHGHKVDCLGRVDLAGLTSDAGVSEFTRVLARARPDALHLIVIAAPDGPVPPVPHRALVDTLTAAFARLGLPVKHAAWAPDITARARWHCYHDPGCTGSLPDPHTTPVAAAGAVAGVVIHPDRRSVAALLTPDDPAALGRRAQLIPAATPGDGTALVRAAVHNAARSVLPDTDEQIAALAAALSTPHTRDDCLTLLLGPLADAAAHLWTALTRATPAPHRAEPAVLLAIAAALRGDGVLANLAADTAIEANPAHPLAQLVRTAIAGGMSPNALRAVITSVT